MSALLRNEWQQLVRSRAAVLALVVYAAAVAGAAMLGSSRAATGRERAQQAMSQALAERARWVDAARKRAAGEPTPGFPEWRDPTSVVMVGGWLGTPAVRFPSPTAFLAAGSLGAAPSSAVVTMRNVGKALEVEELVPPRQLELGPLDPALLLLLVLPLLVVGLGHDLLSSHRARGTLTMLVLAGVSPWQVVVSRAVVRGAAVWGATMVALLPFLVMNGAGPGATLALAVGVAALVAVWLGLCAVLDARRTGAGVPALAAVGLWVVTSLALPGVVHAVAHLAWPLPARSGDAVAERAAEVALADKDKQLLSDYLKDHPELAPPTEDEWQRAYLLSLDARRRELTGIQEERRRLRETQAAARDLVALLSPGMLFQQVVEDLAGASHRAYRDFEDEVARFQDAWHARFFAQAMALTSLEPEALEALPVLEMKAAPRVPVAALAGLVVLAVLGWGAALLALRRAVLR